MTTTSCPGPDLLLLHHHGLLDEPEDDCERQRLDAHLHDCPSCRAWSGRALATPALPFDPAEVLGEIHARIDAYEAEAAPLSQLDLNVRLLCTYCKDGLPAPQAFYCADCLAPHHDDCFAEHGHCSAPGCECRRVVRSAESPQPVRAPRWRRAGLLVLGVALGGGAVAALVPERPAVLTRSDLEDPAQAELQRERRDHRLSEARLIAEADQQRAQLEALRARASASRGDFELQVYQVADLIQEEPVEPQEPEWVQTFRQILASRKVTLNFPQTPLGEVVAFLQDITGLNVVLSPDVDAEAYTVSLRLRDIPLTDALRIIQEQCGLASTFANESYVIHAGLGRWAVDPSHPPLRPSSNLLRAESLLDRLRTVVHSEEGMAAWEPPASAILEGGALVVNQLPAAHGVIRTWLATLRHGEAFPAQFAEAWFAPAAGAQETPSLRRALALRLRLQRQRITLNFDESPFAEALQFLRDIAGIDIRVDPGVATQLEEATVSLRLRDITLGSALELICAVDPQLVWDIDRRGILIRSSGTPSYEARLEEGAGRRLQLDAGSGDIRARLAGEQVKLEFAQAPLSEVLDHLRDVTGFNLVLAPGLSDELQVNLVPQRVSISEGLEHVLMPLGLGYRIESGVVYVVPRAEAAERPELRAQVELAQGATLSEGGLGLTLAELVAQLERAFEGEVVLGARARSSLDRLALPPTTTVERALRLAASQASLEYGWTWVDSRLVLAIDQREAGALARFAVAVSGSSAWETAPEPVLQVERGAADALTAALVALAETPSDGLWHIAQGTSRFESLLEDAQRQFERLEDVRRTGRDFAPRPDFPEAGGRDVVGDVARGVLQARADLRQTMRFHQLELLELESKLEGARVRAAEIEQESRRKRELLDARLAGLSQDDLQRMVIEDLIVAHEQDSAQRRAETLDAARAALDHSDRDWQLAEARLHSELSQHQARLQDLLGHYPGYEDCLNRLLEGEAWDTVFPQGYAAWCEAELEAGAAWVAAGSEALQRLGAVFDSELRVTRVSAGGLAHRAGVRPGDRLVHAGGDLQESLRSLLLYLGDPEHAGVATGFLFAQIDGAELQVRLALPLCETRGHLPLEFEPPLTIVADAPPLLAGDMILAVDGVLVESRRQIAVQVAGYAPGQQVSVTAFRGGGGECFDWEVPVVARPDGATYHLDPLPPESLELDDLVWEGEEQEGED